MPWSDELDNDLRGYVANKGWDKLEGPAAAAAVAKSYRELERSRPEAPPKDASGYTFEGVAQKDGSKPDTGFLDFAKSLAAELHLPVSAANTLATKLLARGDSAVEAETNALKTALDEGTARLKTAWGAEFDAKNLVASRAFEAMGLPKEIVDALVEKAGVDKVMEAGFTLGSKMEEAPLLRGGGMEAPAQKFTRDQALAERNRLTGDKVFAAKIMEGDSEALKQLNDLSRAIVGTPDNWQSAPPNFGRTKENPSGDPNWRPGGPVPAAA